MYFRQLVSWIFRGTWATSSTSRKRCSHIRRAISDRCFGESSGKAWARFSSTTLARMCSTSFISHAHAAGQLAAGFQRHGLDDADQDADGDVGEVVEDVFSRHGMLPPWNGQIRVYCREKRRLGEEGNARSL